MLRLYTYFRSSAAFRVRIALNLKGLAWDYVAVNIIADGGGEQATADYRARFSAVAAGTAGLPPLEVVLFVGDNIQDFPALSQDVRDDGDDALAGFTDRFVLLANPMYGSWEKNL